MQPEAAKYLEDVRQACRLLQDFTVGKSFADYLADPLLRAGVEREFILIGEALFQASRKDATIGQSIAMLPQIIGFRNILVHGYATIQHQTVWGVVQNDLTPLKQEVEKLLAQAGPP